MVTHRWSSSRSSLSAAAFYAGCSDFGCYHHIEFFFIIFLFSRKTSPEHIPGDTEGAESRARLQETSASGSLNGKLVKLHQIHVKVVTEVEIIILYSVLSKGRMNAMEMLRNYLKRKR